MVLQSSKKPEEVAREDIDKMLELSGWKVQDIYEMKPSESIGVAVTEAHLKAGFSDYLLFADRRPVGIIEAKPKRIYPERSCRTVRKVCKKQFGRSSGNK